MTVKKIRKEKSHSCGVMDGCCTCSHGPICQAVSDQKKHYCDGGILVICLIWLHAISFSIS